MRIGLQDDSGLSRCAPTDGAFTRLIGLDDDLLGGSCGCGDDGGTNPDEPDPRPTAAIRSRSRLYYDAQGTPTYQWEEIGSGPVVLLQERRELNDATGQTQVLASALVSWADELATPDETSVLWSGGVRYEVLACDRLPGRLDMKLERLSDAE